MVANKISQHVQGGILQLHQEGTTTWFIMEILFTLIGKSTVLPRCVFLKHAHEDLARDTKSFGLAAHFK